MRYTVERICELYKQNPEIGIIPFWGHHMKPGKITKGCLSQWFDCCFEVDGIAYHTTEQYMMSQKALLFGDRETCEKIMASDNPNDYKALGRQVQGFDQRLWDENKYEIVLKGNLAKFGQNPKLKDYLFSTGDSILVEASPYDAVWGVRLAIDDECIKNPENWQGENLLGCALMETRAVLRGDSEAPGLGDPTET